MNHKFLPKFNSRLLLALILLINGALVVPGLTQDILYDCIPEDAMRMNIAMRMITIGDLNPHWFNHPGSLVIYFLAFSYSLFYTVGMALGFFSSFSDFFDLWLNDPSYFILIGRIFSRIFALLSVALTYILTRRVTSRQYALLACLLIAINPVFITHAHRLRMDHLVTVFFLVFLYFCFNITETRRWVSYVQAGVTAGLAITVKYTASIFIPVMLFCSLLSEKRIAQSLITWLGFLTVTGACTFLASPYLILNWQESFLGANREISKASSQEIFVNFGDHLYLIFAEFFPDGFTELGVALIVVGCLTCLLSTDNKKRLLALFFLSYVVLISLPSTTNKTWIVPVIPIASFFFVDSVRFFLGFVFARLGSIHGFFRYALLVVVGGIVVVSLQRDVGIFQFRVAQTTHTSARQWILENIPPGSAILLDTYSPALPASKYLLFQRKVDGGIKQLRPCNIQRMRQGGCGIHTHTNIIAKGPQSRLGGIDLDILRANNIQYVLFNRLPYRKYSKEDLQSSYDKLLSQLWLMHSFHGYTKKGKRDEPHGDYGCWGEYEVYEVPKQKL